MEAKSPSLLDVWRSQAVRQLTALPGGRAGVARERSAGAVPLQPAVRRPLRGRGGVRDSWRARERLLRVEVGAALLGGRGAAALRGRAAGPGAAHRRACSHPATLLDVLRDYVVYEPERGRLVKKLPRYQQYRAVRAAVERLLSGRRPEERGGVVWHTQGSGKSLTMLWLATKLRREPRLSSCHHRGGDGPQAA